MVHYASPHRQRQELTSQERHRRAAYEEELRESLRAARQRAIKAQEALKAQIADKHRQRQQQKLSESDVSGERFILDVSVPDASQVRRAASHVIRRYELLFREADRRLQAAAWRQDRLRSLPTSRARLAALRQTDQAAFQTELLLAPEPLRLGPLAVTPVLHDSERPVVTLRQSQDHASLEVSIGDETDSPSPPAPGSDSGSWLPSGAEEVAAVAADARRSSLNRDHPYASASVRTPPSRLTGGEPGWHVDSLADGRADRVSRPDHGDPVAISACLAAPRPHEELTSEPPSGRGHVKSATPAQGGTSRRRAAAPPPEVCRALTTQRVLDGQARAVHRLSTVMGVQALCAMRLVRQLRTFMLGAGSSWMREFVHLLHGYYAADRRLVGQQVLWSQSLAVALDRAGLAMEGMGVDFGYRFHQVTEGADPSCLLEHAGTVKPIMPSLQSPLLSTLVPSDALRSCEQIHM
jgi:hypothetical protein